MPYEVYVTHTCRCLRRAPGGIRYNELVAELKMGKKVCPIAGITYTMVVDHPAGNIAGRQAVKKFPDKCPLCNLETIWSDFNVR